MTAIEFLRRAGNDGRIVSSNDLSSAQIVHAQACGRFFVDPETRFGWAIVPWECTTPKDIVRECNNICAPEGIT